jgi:membrane protease YdiL (CAAX protease family)
VFVGTYLLIGVIAPVLSATLEPELARGIFFPFSLALLGGLTVAWVAVRHRGHVRDLLGPSVRLADVGWGVGHGVVAFLVINLGFSIVLQLMAQATGADVPEVQQNLRDATQDGRIGLIVTLSAIAVAPLAEEVFFRGLLFRGLRGPLGLWPAIGISAFLFGIAHYEEQNLQGSLYALLVLASFGMYLAWAFDRRRSLLTPIAMHATFNGLAIVGISLAG